MPAGFIVCTNGTVVRYFTGSPFLRAGEKRQVFTTLSAVADCRAAPSVAGRCGSLADSTPPVSLTRISISDGW